jgi:hypothetical protein
MKTEANDTRINTPQRDQPHQASLAEDKYATGVARN